MPTFLATDYLQEAVGCRQAVCERMLLPEPDHLEAADSSINQKQDPTKNSWKEEFREAGQLIKTESGTPEIEAEILSLTLSILPVAQELFDDSGLGSSPWSQCWQEGLGLDDSHVPDDVDVVLEEACEEVFCAADVMSSSLEVEDVGLWFSEHRPDVIADVEGMCLEDVIMLDDLETYMKRLPGSNALCRRLKSKVVQDPFLTRHGELISEKLLLGSEFDYEFNPEEATCPNDYQMPEEVYACDLTFFHDDSYEELFVPDEVDAMELASDLSNLQQVTDFVDLQHENIDETGSPGSLISADLLKLSETCGRAVDKPEILSPLVDTHQSFDFLKSNSKGCEDTITMVQTAVLESPILSPHPVVSSTQLPFSLSSLSPIPVSPSWSVRLISPNSTAEIEKRQTEIDRSFDDVLGLMLVVPKLQLDFPSPPQSNDVVEVLQVSEYQYSSELELNLPWDPLADSVDVMIKGRAMLVREWQYPKISVVTTTTIEEFVKNEPFYAYDGDDLPLPLSFALNSTAVVLSAAPGVPTWKSNAEPQGYHRTVLDTLSHSDMTMARPVKSKHRHSRKQIEKERTDVLGGFLFLRGTERSSVTENVSVPYNKLDDSYSLHSTHIPHTRSLSEPQLTGMERWKTKDVKLPGVFKEVLAMIEQRGEMVVNNLRQLGVLSPSETFRSVPLENLRFLLKEQEKSFDQLTDSNGDSLESYKLTACLYTLIDVADLLINCSFRSATTRFSSIQQQQRDVLGTSLEGLAQSLLANQCSFEEQKIVHPAIAVLVDMATKIVKNRDKERVRALFIVSRSTTALLDEIGECLGKVEGLTMKLVYPDVDGSKLSDDQVTSFVEDNDCVVTSVSCVLSNGFPWHEFQLIVRYEKGDSAAFNDTGLEASELLNCKLVVLNVVGYSLQQGITDLDRGTNEWNSQQMIFIGSRLVVEDRDLLQLLEARYNIVIVERNFEELEDPAARQYYADTIVDERTCIVLLMEADLRATADLKALRHRVTALSFKYEICWIILRCKGETAEESSFGGSGDRNIARLLASIAHFSQEANGFNAHLVYAFSVDETARLMREIGENAYDSTTVWQKAEWIQRSWLTEQMSLHEKFLLFVPSINSFSAQVMLTTAPLRELLSMSIEDLFSVCRWLPTRVLEHFYQTIQLGRKRLVISCDSDKESPVSFASLRTKRTDKSDAVESARNIEDRVVYSIKTSHTDPTTHEQQPRVWHSRFGNSCGLERSDYLMDRYPVTAQRYSALQPVCTSSLERCDLMAPSDSDERLQFRELNFYQHQDDRTASRRSACRLPGDQEAPVDSHASSSSGYQFQDRSLPKRRCLGGIDSTTKSTENQFRTARLHQCPEAVSTYFDRVHKDRQVPGADLLQDDAYPSTTEWSVFSPSLVSPRGKKLTYIRVPGSADGQTKLSFL